MQLFTDIKSIKNLFDIPISSAVNAGVSLSLMATYDDDKEDTDECLE